jgi:hypothetical protein
VVAGIFKRIFLSLKITLLPVLFCSGCASSLRDQCYMPLAVGNRWDYRIETDQGKISTRTLELTSKTKDDVFRCNDGVNPGAWAWRDGFLSFEQAGSRVYLLMIPVRGAGWWTRTPEGHRVWCRVLGLRRITVPAGTFEDCVEVVMQPQGGRSEMRHWFARNVGWIRYSCGLRGKKPWMVRELVNCKLREVKAGK